MRRDFTYVDDVVTGILQASRRPVESNGSNGHPAGCRLYNIGGSRPVELYELVSTLETCLGVEAKLRFLPMQAGDVLETCADIDASIRDFNFRPRVTLRQGLERFVKWYRDYHGEVRGTTAVADAVVQQS
jgi:UDP-glucuronate 4-epimerase